MAKSAFISHITEEREVGSALKTALARDFLGMLDVFVSSDGASIAAGDDWLKSVDEALRKTDLMMILCSPTSIRRPWINFEAGAAWIRKIPIIPLCHSGLRPGDLPMPLSSRQGLLLSSADSLRGLYERIAKEMECGVPPSQFDELASKLGSISVPTDQADQESLSRDRAVKDRLEESLKDHKFKWRSLERVALEAAISEEMAADHLRADSSVRFSKGKTGNIIVGLRSRVDA